MNFWNEEESLDHAGANSLVMRRVETMEQIQP
jgi:hypothetical protein